MKNCFYICLLIVFAKLVNAEELPVKEIDRVKKEASLAVSEGNLQKALESYAVLANEYPTNLEVANDVAVILAGLGRLNEARQVLEVAFQKHPKVGKAFINLREILARQASVEYRKALDKKPPSTSLVLQSENIDLTRKYEIVKVDRVEIEKNNDALNEIGYAGKNVDFKPSQYFEVHIEQGKLLEAKKAAVGIVSNSWGARKLKILIKGKPDHTGPTPMDIRSDALLLASRIIIKVNEIAILSNGTLHSSVGRMDLSPNSPNTVVEEAKLWIEFRGVNDLELDQAEAKINEFMTMNHLASNCDIQQISREDRKAVKFDELAFTRICVALKRNNINYLEMTTVAGHDALQLQSYCPSTLIFIPSKDGISHSPDEYTSDTDILNGYNASLIALSELFFEDN